MTVTSTADAPSGGVVAVMELALSTVNDDAGSEPNITPLTAAKLVPVIVTDVPPETGPATGPMLVTVGMAKYVNSSAVASGLDGPGVVTVTSTVPAALAGSMAEIDVELFTVNAVAATSPKLTAETPEKFVPEMVTETPPEVHPRAGETLVTAGGM
jgi:hypothetical protein